MFFHPLVILLLINVCIPFPPSTNSCVFIVLILFFNHMNIINSNLVLNYVDSYGMDRAYRIQMLGSNFKPFSSFSSCFPFGNIQCFPLHQTFKYMLLLHILLIHLFEFFLDNSVAKLSSRDSLTSSSNHHHTATLDSSTTFENLDSNTSLLFESQPLRQSIKVSRPLPIFVIITTIMPLLLYMNPVLFEKLDLIHFCIKQW